MFFYIIADDAYEGLFFSNVETKNGYKSVNYVIVIAYHMFGH